MYNLQNLVGRIRFTSSDEIKGHELGEFFLKLVVEGLNLQVKYGDNTLVGSMENSTFAYFGKDLQDENYSLKYKICNLPMFIKNMEVPELEYLLEDNEVTLEVEFLEVVGSFINDSHLLIKLDGSYLMNAKKTISLQEPDEVIIIRNNNLPNQIFYLERLAQETGLFSPAKLKDYVDVETTKYTTKLVINSLIKLAISNDKNEYAGNALMESLADEVEVEKLLASTRYQKILASLRKEKIKVCQIVTLLHKTTKITSEKGVLPVGTWLSKTKFIENLKDLLNLIRVV